MPWKYFSVWRLRILTIKLFCKISRLVPTTMNTQKIEVAKSSSLKLKVQLVFQTFHSILMEWKNTIKSNLLTSLLKYQKIGFNIAGKFQHVLRFCMRILDSCSPGFSRNLNKSSMKIIELMVPLQLQKSTSQKPWNKYTINFNRLLNSFENRVCQYGNISCGFSGSRIQNSIDFWPNISNAKENFTCFVMQFFYYQKKII